MIKLCAFSDEAGSSISEQIQALKRNGISYTELRSIDGKNVLDFSIEEAIAYQDEFQNNGISVWSIGSPLGKVDIEVDFDNYCKKVEHACKLAKIFKTDKIRIFSFFNAYDKEEKVYRYLTKMVEIGNKHGVLMCHENEKDVFGDTLQRVLKIIKNVDGLKFVYDPANYLQCKQLAEETLDKLHETTYYFHIKDVISQTGALVPAGFGDGKILDLVDKITDDKVLTLEPHLAIFKGYANLDKTQMKHKFVYASANDAFDASVSALKTILLDAGYVEQDNCFVKA